MTIHDEVELGHYATSIPVDRDLLEPLGLVMWAAMRLHHTVRDTIGVDLGCGLSDKPFDATLGGVIRQLVTASMVKGEPWTTAVSLWATGIGQEALEARNRIAHAIPFTAEAGMQALRTGVRQASSERVDGALLNRTAGLLEFAAARLWEVRKQCQGVSTED